MKPKIFLAMLLSWTMAAGVMAEDISTVCVNLKDGSKVMFVLPYQAPVITYAKGMMNINDGALTFKRDEVESLTVEEKNSETVGIRRAQTTRTDIRFDLTHSDVVHVSGLKDADRLQIYGLDGKSVNATVTRQDGEATVDLSQQPRGVYMVSVNQRFTFKMMKP